MAYSVPLLLRGDIIESDPIEFGGRRGGASFTTPDVSRHIDRLPLALPSAMADLYGMSFTEIVDFLDRLGQRLDPARNAWLQEAYELSRLTSGLSDSILRYHFGMIPHYFTPDSVRAIAERTIGVDYLEGWVEQPPSAQAGTSVRIRALGARAVHIIAGNVPVVGVTTVIRNAITRSDAIIKTPSNDPLTTAAVVRTMIEMAPDHPITRHVSVAYWKGGDERIEAALYDPRRIEKIVAWGGFAGIKHVTRYIQPGLDLITLDPKHSGSLIGRQAFADETTLRAVARRLAVDIGAMNQEGCVNARVIHVESGTDADGIARADRLAALTFEALQGLPEYLSTPHKAFDPELKAELAALAFVDDEYRVFGGRSNEGAVIVSRSAQPVDFARMLACRVANIVPVDDLETAVRSVNSYTQTIGIYPDALKQELRDRLAFQGAQRLVSLGGAATLLQAPGPQDGIEPLRRMVKWITDESGDGDTLEAQAIAA
ncbi:acyl-CoA reductase [Sphingomonas sp. KC8]|uniref:acyl-CoA reductase n=1 Tax=Sphingomonas sp. KC8 TaxID=1030157 RepID=UPI0002489C81|nr:acyl-CoA reductase [Sphingomonas sp. KC8]ARS27256.1 long-chain-fatty-acyl-CoA reductase [Sphingomonas sp. KC8]